MLDAGSWSRGGVGRVDRRERLSHLGGSSRTWGLRFRLRRWNWLLGLLDGLAAGVLQTLQLALRSGVGALEAALGLPEPVEHGELGCGLRHVREDGCFPYFHAAQFPLRDRHLLDIELFGPGLGIPFGFEIVAKLIEFLAIFARQHDGAGAKSVTEGVHADSSLTLGSFGASRLLRVASISLELFECRHIVSLRTKPNLELQPEFRVFPDQQSQSWLHSSVMLFVSSYSLFLFPQ